MNLNEIRETEIYLMLLKINEKYGFDFTDYAFNYIRRRIEKIIHDESLTSVSELQSRILQNVDWMEKFLNTISINVTDMFRDPDFFLELRYFLTKNHKDNTFFRIWDVGCSTGEEVYSLAIILSEEGIYEKSLIYATDFNSDFVEKAKKGIFPLDLMINFTRNYLKSGGKKNFSDFYYANYENAIMHSNLKKKIVFYLHNLVTDAPFNEFDIIICRNVLIYFNEALQDHVISLFLNSLRSGGLLCLGSKESLRASKFNQFFKEINDQKMYIKL